MSFLRELIKKGKNGSEIRSEFLRFSKLAYRIFRVGLATLLLIYFSLIISSTPVSISQREMIDKAIDLLEEKGFENEAILFRRTVLFRNTDNWLNSLVNEEKAYAATNYPFEIVTIYPDFYDRTKDDTERAMILLHEARHLQGGDEQDAYSFVWSNRKKLGWNILPYGTTDVFIETELQTREYAPELFKCPEKLWNDCTGDLKVQK